MSTDPRAALITQVLGPRCEVPAEGCMTCLAWSMLDTLKKCAEPISSELAMARQNLVLYKGYSSRERRYRIEIEDLEKLLKEIEGA